MIKKRFVFILSMILIAGTISSCSLQGEKSTSSATAVTAAAVTDSQSQPKETDVSDAIEGDLLDEMEKPLAGLLLVFGQYDYNADTAISNEQAIDYLCHMARLFYSVRAANYDALGTEFKYIAFDETEVSQILDEAFNGRYSTADLLTQDTAVIYNAHTYYVPMQEGADAPETFCTGGNMSTNEYSFKITGQGTETEFTLTIVPSGNNPAGYSITSIEFD